MKQCACGDPVSKGGKTRCKACDAEYKWYYNQKKRFGLSRLELDEMYRKQSGVCALCYTPFTAQRPCVDHCHETNKVRGLLCHHCNTALGLFRDNKDVLANAIKYLAE